MIDILGMTEQSRKSYTVSKWIAVYLFIFAFAINGFTAQDIDKIFKEPPSETRILKIIHNWQDKPEDQDKLIERLKRQGFGGVVCNVSFENYLQSEQKWQAFTRAVKRAKDEGFCLWLYDERGYPSGNAGGLVLKENKEWQAKGLLISQGSTTNGKVEIDVPPGKLVLCLAFPLKNNVVELKNSIDLRGFVKDKRLVWSAPSGQWRVIAICEDKLYDGTHAELNLWEKIPYINLLQPEPTARFIELTHQKYAEKLGTNLGKYFEATFTDEPSLMSVFLREMPWQVLPWSDNLPVEFKKRRGYPIDSALISLVSDTDEIYKKHWYDFWLTVGELVSENFFGQIQKWCAKHNILSGGHLLAEENTVHHVGFYGDFFRCLRRLDAPGIDCLTSIPSEVPYHIARLAASAAELEGKTVVMCETSDHSQVYRPQGDKRPKRIVTEAEIRGTLNRLFVNGINRITSYYSFTGLTDEQLQRLNLWAGRCGYLINNSRHYPDIALVYPAESLWIRFIPSKLWAKDAVEAAKIDSIYRGAMNSMFFLQQDFTIIDSQTLIDGKVKDGTFVYRANKWKVIVLPGLDTLPLKAWENLHNFVKNGGVLICLSNLPENSERDFPSLKVRAITKELFGTDVKGAGVVLKKFNKGLVMFLGSGGDTTLNKVIENILHKDIQIKGDTRVLRITKRQFDGKDLFFIINDSPNQWNGEINFATAKNVECLNPADGSITRNIKPDGIKIALEPYGGIFYAVEKINRAATPIQNQSFNISINERPLQFDKVTFARGEFVNSSMQQLNNAGPGKDKWEATAILTKSNVDTWMFLRFIPSAPISLKGGDFLVFEAQVPPQQSTRNQLLVILKEKDGGEFIAETGHFLNDTNAMKVYVPFSKFNFAGWSKDADGILDLDKVEEIRIGWGGYTGSEGEKISFTVSAPAIGAFDYKKLQTD